ncbi:MAG: Rha family transcriptional regulator [Agrobacterium sp.]|nr:Rha family transcriptional regulator [Agrobacterium sp.]
MRNELRRGHAPSQANKLPAALPVAYYWRGPVWIDFNIRFQVKALLHDTHNVADYFEKRHADVLRSIDCLDCSTQFTERNFAFSGYLDSTGRTLRSIDMSKDGFTFLAMGFTGTKAARFKEAYIAQFNAIEAELRERDDEPQIVSYTPEAEAGLLVGQARRDENYFASAGTSPRFECSPSPALKI